MVDASSPRRRRGDLAPDPELWAALDEGRLMRAILEDFYDRVFDDPKLAPFFEGVTKEWAIGKQYSFLMQIFTGERVYFGARPRNAHHWMVISDALFDYRERMIEKVMREHGLAEPFVQRWLAAHEVFRKQIVKDAAVPKKIRGVAIPLEGFDSVELLVGSVCDGCEAVMEVGTVARYHVRTGKAYCPSCAPEIEEEESA